MIPDHELLYKEKHYQIISIEQEFMIHPAALGLQAVSKASLSNSFSAAFHIADYQLWLDKITIYYADNSMKQYEFENCRISYSGAILIGSDLIKEYSLKDKKTACFSYQNVKELIFEEGTLKTTIDQNRAMQRIRKNLELGLRCLNNSRDIRCIRRFMTNAFVGDYKPFLLSGRRLRYLQEMQKLYSMRS